ncbi:hypothetical protein JTE90_012762 [Oedothorax gibbosus]|uniref:U3 small nucleolar RNA-associated protein 14 A n=1 Tax=Oedothorax gibbosus TaxID=931172 RepID=A0AAV6W0H9_9ARAC|nr:hypothetical protein JTE90_012762 [Oedothorax gibbosus]
MILFVYVFRVPGFGQHAQVFCVPKMQKKIKNKKSAKRKSLPQGWTVTESSEVDTNELYQVKASVASNEKETDVKETQSSSSIYDLPTEGKNKRKMKGGILMQRTEASQIISEFNLNEVGKERVKLNELIKTSQVVGQMTVKKQLENAKKLKSLSVPLSKPQLEKIKRTVAYEKVCNEVTKWEPVVRSNRVAEQIIYPLAKPPKLAETFEKTAERFVTRHPIEDAVNALLNKSEHKMENTKTLTAAEEKALQTMSLKEAKLRHQELMKHRALISYQEMKARRQNKIKSKRYHRMLKRDKMKKLLKEFESLQNVDASAAIEKIMEVDNMRVMERMTLKHRNTGKWAKMQKIRAKYNPEARSVLKEDINMGKELKNKLPEIQTQISTLRARIQSDLTEGDSTGLIEGSSPLDLDNLEEIVPPLELEPTPNSMEDKVVGNRTQKTKVQKPAKTTSDFTDMDFISKATALKSSNPSLMTVGDCLDEVESQSEDSADEGVKNLSEAFADEDIIAEFREDKRAVEEANRPKGIDLFLPGWGSWGGEGIKDSKKKRKRFYIKPIEEKRAKKHTLGNVIVNEEADKKAAVHQVCSLPFPFTNVHNFESHIRQPVGHTWNPQSGFQSLTKPKVVTKAGKVILPIDAEDVVLEKKTATKEPKVPNETAEEPKAF